MLIDQTEQSGPLERRSFCFCIAPFSQATESDVCALLYLSCVFVYICVLLLLALRRTFRNLASGCFIIWELAGRISALSHTYECINSRIAFYAAPADDLCLRRTGGYEHDVLPVLPPSSSSLLLRCKQNDMREFRTPQRLGCARLELGHRLWLYGLRFDEYASVRTLTHLKRQEGATCFHHLLNIF